MMINFMIVFMFMYMYKFNKFIIQMLYQNLIILMFLLMVIKFPLNNLNNWVMIYYIFSVDFYSLGMNLLSLWIFMLMVLVSGDNFLKVTGGVYSLMISFLLFMLILCFSSMNLIIFYIFFESSLIPIFMLIVGWGGQIDRVQAGIFMMMYTLVGSMPMFVIIIYLYVLNNSFHSFLDLISFFWFFLLFDSLFHASCDQV